MLSTTANNLIRLVTKGCDFAYSRSPAFLERVAEADVSVAHGMRAASSERDLKRKQMN